MNSSDQILQVLRRCHAQASLNDDETLHAFAAAISTIEASSLGSIQCRRLRIQANPRDIDRIRDRLAALQPPSAEAPGSSAPAERIPADSEKPSPKYEVILGPAAIRAILGMSSPGEHIKLATALRAELAGGFCTGKEVRLDADGNPCLPGALVLPGEKVYTATPLSFRGCTALHRPMTGEELDRLQREQGRPVAGRGFYVIGLLDGLSASKFTIVSRPAVADSSMVSRNPDGAAMPSPDQTELS
jgi:hypothetical protein